MNSSLLVSFLITLCFPLITPHLLFHLVPNQARCYVDELFSDSVMMIKWKIYTFNVTFTIYPIRFTASPVK